MVQQRASTGVNNPGERNLLQSHVQNCFCECHGRCISCLDVTTVPNPQDLDRQVVKTEWAEISIPEIDFVVTKQPGLITTIEGIIDRAVGGLQETAPQLAVSDPENIIKLSQFIVSLGQLKMVEQPFTFVSNQSTVL